MGNRKNLYLISFKVEEFKDVIFTDNRRIKGILFLNIGGLKAIIIVFHSILSPFFSLQDKSIRKRWQKIYMSGGKIIKNADIVSVIKNA